MHNLLRLLFLFLKTQLYPCEPNIIKKNHFKIMN
jgi:hypothetical protein